MAAATLTILGKEVPNYRRDYTGTVYFFTLVTHKRQPFLTTPKARFCLRHGIEDCRQRFPFEIKGWVLLPDHLHCLWELSLQDNDYSRRWSIIKRRFTQTFGNGQDFSPPFWQKRFWARRISDDQDFEDHLNYIHFNPVKHGFVPAASQWPWTSFHSYVKMGLYPPDWAEGGNYAAVTGPEYGE